MMNGKHCLVYGVAVQHLAVVAAAIKAGAEVGTESLYAAERPTLHPGPIEYRAATTPPQAIRPMSVFTRRVLGWFLLPGFALALPACAEGPPQAAVATVPASASARTSTQSLCTAGELTLFRCPVSRGRQIAICASGTPGTPDARAQYRFGRPGQVELVYPADAAAGPQELLTSHYGRPGVERLTIHFETPAAEYYVSDWTEAGEPSIKGVDVTPKQPGVKGIHIACTGPVTADYAQIAARLRCDRESALATCH